MTSSRKATPLSSTSTSPVSQSKRRPFAQVSSLEPPIGRVKRIEHYIKFPLLCADYVSKTNTILVAGGGGPGHHGIGNGMVNNISSIIKSL